jgi:hypothetical protein
MSEDHDLINKYWLPYDEEVRLFAFGILPDTYGYTLYNEWMDFRIEIYLMKQIREHNLLEGDLELANQFRDAVYKRMRRWKINK